MPSQPDKQELLLHRLTAVSSYSLASMLVTESVGELISLDWCDEGSNAFSTCSTLSKPHECLACHEWLACLLHTVLLC